jgi:hypothetical protein
MIVANAPVTVKPVGAGGIDVSVTHEGTVEVVVVELVIKLLNPLVTTVPLGNGLPDKAPVRIIKLSRIGRRIAATVGSLTALTAGILGKSGRLVLVDIK